LALAGFSGSQASTAKPGQDGRNALDDEEPLPVGQVAHAFHAAMMSPAMGPLTAPAMANEVMKRPLTRARRLAGTVGQIQHHAGEEAGFKDAQQEAQDETGRRVT
jgi:hypothetical protein